MEEKAKLFYDRLTQDGYKLPEFNTFYTGLQDEQKAKTFYDRVSSDGYKLPEFDKFYSTFKPVQQTEQPVQEQQKPTSTMSAFADMFAPKKKEPTSTSKFADYLAIANNRFYNFPADVLDTYSIASSFIENKLSKIGLGKETKPEDIWASKVANEWRGFVDNIAPVNQEVRETFSGQVVDGLAQILPIVLTAGTGATTTATKELVKQAAKSGKSISPYVEAGKELISRFGTPQGIVAGSQIAAPSYQQAIAEGATNEEALDYAIENFAMGGIMENLPVASMFKRLSQVAPESRILDILKQGVVGFSEEAATEMMQESYANMSANRIYEANRAMLDGVGEAGAVGGTVGFILNASLSALIGRRANITNPQERQIVDEAIKETEQKLKTVNENNAKIEEAVTELDKKEVVKLNDGEADLDFVKIGDSVEFVEDGMSEKSANELVSKLSERYPNMEFTVENRTGQDPMSPVDFAVIGNPKQQSVYKVGDESVSKDVLQLKIETADSVAELEGISIENDTELESALQNKVEELNKKLPTEPMKTIDSMAGETVTVNIGGKNVSGQVVVDEGGKVEIHDGNTIYEVDNQTPFSEFVRPVQVTGDGFEVNGESFTEARIVTENGQNKALLIREDGTTKVITNPRVVEEIDYQIRLAEMESMTDQESDQLWNQYEQQRETETVTEEGTVETDEDARIREAIEEIELIEELALEELQAIDSQSRLVEFTPPSMKEPKVYLVRKNPDGSFSATLNGRKVARQEIVNELGKLYETQSKDLVSKLQEQTNELKKEVESKLLGKKDVSVQEQEVSEQPTTEESVVVEDVRQEQPAETTDIDVQVEQATQQPEQATQIQQEEVAENQEVTEIKEQDLETKQQEDAISIEEAGQVPVQPEARISERVEEGKSETELEEVTAKEEVTEPTTIQEVVDQIPETGERISFEIFEETKTGTRQEGRIVGDDGTKYQPSMVQNVKPIKGESKVDIQKKKVRALRNSLKDQINQDKSGVMFDFEQRAKDDIKFFNTLKNLVNEYLKLKGLQFNEFIQQTQKIIGKDLGKKNRDYLKSLWDEAKKEKPLPIKEQIKKSTESKPDTKKTTLVNDYTELKRSLRERAKASREGAKAEAKRVAELRGELSEFIKENKAEINNLGAKLSSTILNRVNDVKSELSLNKAIEYIDKVLTDQDFRNKITEKENLINKIKEESDPKKQVKRESGVVKSKRRQTAEGISVLKQINKALGMSRIEGETKIQEIQQKLQDPDLTEQQRFDLEAEMYAANFAGLDELSNNQIKQLLDEIKEIKKTDRIDALKAVQEYREKINKNIEDALDVIDPSKKARLPEYLTPKSAYRPQNKLLGFANMQNNWIWLLDKLSKFDKSSVGLQSFLNKKFDRELVATPNQNEQQARRDVLKSLQEKFSEIFEAKTPKQREKTLVENTIPKPFTYTDINGNEVNVEMSMNNIYKRWMEMQDETLIPTFEKMGMGQDYLNALESAMTPEIKKWAEWQLKEFYPKYVQGINDVYKRVFGIEMPIRENYSPIQRQLSNVKDDTNSTFNDGNILNTVNNGSLKERVGSTLPLKELDGDKVLINYIYQMEFFKNHSEPLKELSQSMLNGRVTKAIAQIHGDEYVKAIRRHIDTFYRKPENHNWTEKQMEAFRKNFTVSTLAVNPVSFIKQLTSIPAYANWIPTGQWVKGLAKFSANPVKNAQFLYDNSRFMQLRLEKGGFDRDAAAAMAKDWKTVATGKSNFANKVMFMTKWGDAAAIYMGGYPVYDYNYREGLKQGMTQQEAQAYGIQKFEEATEYTQQASDVQNLNLFQKGNEFFRVLTMYKTSPIAYHSLAMGAMRNLRYGRGEVGDNLKQFAIFHIALPVIFQWASAGFRMAAFDEDPDLWFETLRAAVFGNVNALFMAGDFVEYAWKKNVEGAPFEYSPNTTISSLFSNIGKSSDKLKKVLENDFQFEDIITAVDQLFRTSSQFVPALSWYNQVSRVAEGVTDTAMGETDFPVQRSLGWSSWALGENPYQNRQKNYIFEKALGKDYKKKAKNNRQGEEYIDLSENDKMRLRLLK